MKADDYLESPIDKRVQETLALGNFENAVSLIVRYKAASPQLSEPLVTGELGREAAFRLVTENNVSKARLVLSMRLPKSNATDVQVRNLRVSLAASVLWGEDVGQVCKRLENVFRDHEFRCEAFSGYENPLHLFGQAILTHAYAVDQIKQWTAYEKEMRMVIMKIRVNTVNDHLVCEKCSEASKNTYTTSTVPILPICPECRCFYTASVEIKP